jgi:hypothetical protein
MVARLVGFRRSPTTGLEPAPKIRSDGRPLTASRTPFRRSLTAEGRARMRSEVEFRSVPLTYSMIARRSWNRPDLCDRFKTVALPQSGPVSIGCGVAAIPTTGAFKRTPPIDP